ncbi:MAG: ECF transporter S component [Chloroflexi bacterium]|nr:ECF transporter S component [Chloroflexota bacterium]
MKRRYIFLTLILALGIASFMASVFSPSPLDILSNWGLVSTILVSLAITAFFFEFEEAAVSSKEIALVGMLGTVATVIRIPFAAIPSVQPCTALIICSGYVFGPVAGFMVGAITALVSNFFLGQGPWTIYQMFAWGMAGISAAYLKRFNLSTRGLIAFGIIWGYAFGAIMNTWFWASFIYPLTLKTFIVAQLNSVWFDTAHAVGTAVLLGLFGKKTIAILERFKEKFQWGTLKTDLPPTLHVFASDT